MECDPLEPNSEFEEESLLDICSEPPLSASEVGEVRGPNISKACGAGQQARFYFGCCRVVAVLQPPEHVLVGKSDIWRVHCPRCGRLTEVLFK